MGDQGAGDRRPRRSELGSRETAIDRRRRAAMERARAELDRVLREQPATDEDVELDDGPVVRRAPAPDPVGSVVEEFVRARGWERRLRGADLERSWEEIVGPELVRRSRPGRMVDGVLQIVVASPQWATQLRYMTTQIRGRVTAVTGLEVTDVTVVVGHVDEPDPS